MNREEQLRQVIDKYSLKYSMPCSDDAYHFALDILKDTETMRQVGWVREEEELEFVLPKGYFNVEITTDYKYLIADTNDSTNWDKIKIPLPKGTWVIKSNFGKCVVIINRQLPKPKPSVMIQANELRIGNWYDHNGSYRQVTPNTIEEVWEGERIYVNPIPLTPEILEKWCGFENDDNDFLIGISERTNLHINLIKKRTLLESYDGIIALCNISYLHQLQNLYFALTGKELNVQLP